MKLLLLALIPVSLYAQLQNSVIRVPDSSTGALVNVGDATDFAIRVLCVASSCSGGGGGSNPAAGPTAAAVPLDASYNGLNVAGNLVGQTGSTVSAHTSADVALHDGAGNAINSTSNALNVNFTNSVIGVTQSTNPWIVIGNGTAGSAGTSVLTIQGIAGMTKLLVTPDANSAVNVAQINGSTVATAATGIAKAGIVDSTGGSITATGGSLNVNVTGGSTGNGAASNTGANVPAQAGYTGLIDQASGHLVGWSGVVTLGGPVAANVLLSDPTLGTAIGVAGAPLFNYLGNIQSSIVWTSGTALNTAANFITQGYGSQSAVINVVPPGTLSGGAITFEGSGDGTNYVTMPADSILDITSTTFAQVAIPYTLVASTTKRFLISSKGWPYVRVKLSTAITGAGNTTITATQQPFNPAQEMIAFSPTAANFLATVTQGTSPWVDNVSQLNGTTIDTNSGNKSAGTMRMVLATDQPNLTSALNVSAAESGTWTVQPGNTPNTTAWLVQPIGGTTNGLTIATPIEPGASDNHQNITTAASTLYHVSITNKGSVNQYVRFYNAGAAFNGCNSASNLKLEYIVPNATANGAGIVDDFPLGGAFSSGIALCVTGAYGQTDTTNATASILAINVMYR